MRYEEIPQGGRPASSAGRLAIRARMRVRRVVARLRGWTDIEALRRSGMQVGEHVFVGLGCHLDPAFCFLITLGDGAVLSLNVTVLAHDASTRAHMGYTRLAPVWIGAGAFVGAGSIILPGVTVGEGAIVGAGSVVRRDVAPYTLVAGNPARVVADHGAYIEHHRHAQPRRPTWPVAGWTATAGVDAEREELMRRSLADGDGYIR
jgi:maltose O-acetyltransferase